MLLKRPATVDISLEILGPDSQNRAYYERRLSKNYSDCGCSWGAAIALIFLVVYSGIIISEVWFPFSWGLILVGLLSTVLSAALGKTMGLALAKTRLRRTINHIKKELRYK
ncbi:MAG: hypothetical protein GY839_10490 [candidate division Zixibacteria bacterium]|nr:hypothetical protein [candidate division Zixibacteria bacterium]